MNYEFEKTTGRYKELIKIETLRKKLSHDERTYHCRIMVKVDLEKTWAYVTNGNYMLKTKIEDGIAAGIYKVLKDKKSLHFVSCDGEEYPDVSEIEKKCEKYGDLKPFTSKSRNCDENASYAYCQIVREIKDVGLNFHLLEPVFNFTEFGYYQLCSEDNNHKPIVLVDSELEANSIAYIMPMRL